MFIGNPPTEFPKRRSNNNEILEISGALTGKVNCCYKLGINKLTGDLYYRDINNTWQPVPSGGSSTSLQVNGTPNGDQSLLNLVPGTNITLTDNGVGGITIDAAIGSSVTANNGLNVPSGSNVQLGGSLLKNTTIDSNSFNLIVSTSVNGITPLELTSTSAPSLTISNTSGAAILVDAASGIGIQATSASANYAADFRSYTAASNNTVQGSLRLISFGGNPPAAAGFGTSLDFSLMTTNGGTIPVANQLISKWTDATQATRTSEFSITGVNSSTTNILLQISGAGIFTLTQGLQNFTNDTTAAAGGIGINQLYRTGSLVAIRVS